MIMKKYSLLFVAVLACLIAACNVVENSETELSDGIIYILANGNEEATKGSVDGATAAFTWNAGDKIAVYANGYKISNSLATEDNGKSSANFGFAAAGSTALVQTDRADFAIFPASLVWDGSAIRANSVTNHTASSLTLTLPSSYTLGQVQNDMAPTPMIAVNAPNGALAFKALCPLLRITVNNIPKQTKRIEFDFNGKKVQGEFTLTGVEAGTTAIATSDTDGSDDIISVTMVSNSVWHDYLVVNLPVPAGTYSNITITAYDAVSAGLPILKISKPLNVSGVAWAPVRNTSSKMTATLPVFSVKGYWGTSTNPNYEPLKVTKKVTFAPGNLVATYTAVASTGPYNANWAFHEHQYDMLITESGTQQSFSYPGKIDLFGFVGSSATGVQYPKTDYHGIQKADYSEALYGNVSVLDGETLKSDWGTLNIGPYKADTWRSLSGSYIDNNDGEWRWLLGPNPENAVPGTNCRATSTVCGTENARFAYAQVNGIKGMIIFPDVYTHPTGVDAIANINRITDSGVWPSDMQNFSVADWEKMEAAGLVFLPCAGARDPRDNGSGTNIVSQVNHRGYYWTSTPTNATQAQYVLLNPSVILTQGLDRRYGFSVRLARDLD